jgi:hypothetical protein
MMESEKPKDLAGWEEATRRPHTGCGETPGHRRMRRGKPEDSFGARGQLEDLAGWDEEESRLHMGSKGNPRMSQNGTRKT